MDGIHDMGGMHGFGSVMQDEDDIVFHDPSEGRMFALSRVLRRTLPFGGDHVRREIERMAPAHYLRSGYYEKWLEGNLAMLKELGVIDEAELAGSPLRPLPASLGTPRAMPPAEAAMLIVSGMPGDTTARAGDALARFSPGERVTTLAHGHAGHTRLPRYARNRTGTVLALRGHFGLADAIAAGMPRREPLYTVAFKARDLWGEEAAEADEVTLDLWDSYLLPPPPA
ncbi:MAG: nitrile hydratase subunit beta [Hyphomicrobiaceae bacterium]